MLENFDELDQPIYKQLLEDGKILMEFLKPCQIFRIKNLRHTVIY